MPQPMPQVPPNLTLMQTKFSNRNYGSSGAKMLDSWHDKKIRKGSAVWKEHIKMCCDHRKAFKDHQHRDPVGLPLDYSKACRVFKAMKTSAASIT